MTIKVGDKVMWRGCFGTDPAREATITSLEITDIPRTKYGDEVDEVSWEDVRSNRVLFGFDNGHWAYSDQIDRGVQL